MAATSWSDVPLDLIDLLVQQIDAITIVRLTAVCTCWSRFFDSRCEHINADMIHFPKLIVEGSTCTDADAAGSSTTKLDLYDIATGRTLPLHLPEAAGRRICGAGKGWMVTVGEDMLVHLLNPTTRETIRLPSLLSIPRMHGRQYQQAGKTLREQRDSFIVKAIVIGTPGSADCVVAALIRGYAGSAVAIVRPGLDRYWKLLHATGGVTDIIYHQGFLFGICRGSSFRFHVWDMSVAATFCDYYPRWMTKVILDVGDRDFFMYSVVDEYLAVVSGEIMVVGRYYHEETKDWQVGLYRLKWDAEGTWMEGLHRTMWELDEVRSTSELKGVKLYKGIWERVTNIGHCCLFLGNNASITLYDPPASLQANCIYFSARFIDTQNYNFTGNIPVPIDYMRVYSLDDGSYRPFYPSPYPWKISPTTVPSPACTWVVIDVSTKIGTFSCYKNVRPIPRPTPPFKLDHHRENSMPKTKRKFDNHQGNYMPKTNQKLDNHQGNCKRKRKRRRKRKPLMSQNHNKASGVEYKIINQWSGLITKY